MNVCQLPGSPQRGYALASAIMLIALAMGASLLMTRVASTASENAELQREKVRAQYLADGATRMIEADLRTRFLDSGNDNIGVYFLGSGDGDIAEWFEDEGSMLVGEDEVDYTITAAGNAVQATGPDGLTATVIVLEVETRAELPEVHAEAHAFLQARLVPVYQFGAFYDMDMDLWPGKDMTITGRIHTNGTLYVGAKSTLRFDTNYVRAVGGLIQDRPWTHQQMDTGQIQFRRFVDDPWDSLEPVEWVTLPREDDLAAAGIPSLSGLDSLFLGYDRNHDGDFADAGEMSPFGIEVLGLFSQPDFYAGGFGSTILTQEHGVHPVQPPELGVTSMFAESAGGDYVFDPIAREYVPTAPGTGTHDQGFYHEHAGLSIIVSNDGTWTAESDGTDVTADLAGVLTISDLADVREGYMVDTAEIDLAALSASGHMPDNGLLYLGHYGAVPLQETKAFVLKNGAELGGPLTTVTENSIYVQGEFNTVDKKPAAVVADTVNLLSSAWDGTKVLTDGSEVHSAADTTYNMAIVSGNRESVWGANHSGGFNNLVRLHENWGDFELTIKGSFVALWEPVYTDAPRTPDAYRVPVRNWGFDPDFLEVDNLPPFTPCYLEINQVVTW